MVKYCLNKKKIFFCLFLDTPGRSSDHEGVVENNEAGKCRLKSAVSFLFALSAA